MNLKKTLSAAVLAGTLVLGTAGVASAAEGSTDRARPTQEQVCARAKLATDRLQSGLERIAGHVEKLHAKRAEAEAAGNTDVVTRIDDRLERLQTAKERIEGRLETIREKMAERCA